MNPTRLALTALSIAAFTAFTPGETRPMHVAEGSENNARTIHADVVVNAPRTDIWNAWTTVEGITTFFAPNAHIELEPGGDFEVYFSDQVPYGERGSEGCTVLSWVEGEMLSFSWNAPPTWPAIRAQRTFVVLRFADVDGERTRVELTNGGYGEGEQWDEVFEYFSNAWPYVLDQLRKRFDDGPRWPDAERMTAGKPERISFLYSIHPARDDFFDTGPTDHESATISRHFLYLQDLVAKNTVLLAGPSFDPTWHPEGEHAVPLDAPAVGVVIFHAESEDAARAIMNNDPAVQAGVFQAKLNQMNVSLLAR